MLVELTIATTGGRLAIAADTIAEVRDLAAYPSRDLERFGRCRVTVRAKRRVHHDVRESYDAVMRQIRTAATAAGARTCKAGD